MFMDKIKTLSCTYGLLVAILQLQTSYEVYEQLFHIYRHACLNITSTVSQITKSQNCAFWILNRLTIWKPLAGNRSSSWSVIVSYCISEYSLTWFSLASFWLTIRHLASCRNLRSRIRPRLKSQSELWHIMTIY